MRVIALGGGRDGSGRGEPLLVIWFVVLGSLPTVVSEYEQIRRVPGTGFEPVRTFVPRVEAWRARVVLSALDRLVPPDLDLRSVRSSLVHEVVAGGLTFCAPSVHSVDVLCRTGCTTIW